jgi:polyisoprenoid-binding protein YceI
MKKHSSILVLALLAGPSAFAQSWSLDKAHSRVGFAINYLGIADVDGSFKSAEAKVNSSKADFSDASVELTADVSTINTDQEQRDNYLKSADFFDAGQLGAVSFKSSGITKIKNKQYQLSGKLTLHGVTKDVVLDMIHNGTTVNPTNKKTVAGFKITGSIKRSDFSLGNSFPAPMLSDAAKLDANIFLNAD